MEESPCQGRLTELHLFSWSATCISLRQRCYMDKEHVKGATDKVVGKTKEVAGHVTGNLGRWKPKARSTRLKERSTIKWATREDAGKEAIDRARNAPGRH